ncbi:MAG: transglutaminase domain-containing protein [Fimbriimonadales bacterium]
MTASNLVMILGLSFAAFMASQLASLPSGTRWGRTPDLDYTLTTTLRVVQPYDVKAMNDEFQQATLLSERDGIATFRITYHLFHRQAVTANPNWKADDAKMVEYLEPRPAANWDSDLQRRILADLKAHGIDPDKLDDKTLVPMIATWALGRCQHNKQFGAWMVEFKNGKPQVAPDLREAFAANEPTGKSDAELFDNELLGKGMYLNKTCADCTSTSSYLATVLRAAGIPTRIIVTVPAADGNDPAQVKMLTDAIRHNRTRKAVSEGISSAGFSNHIFNEVFIGGKWVRLNYTVLGQPIVDRTYEGLITHLYTANDLSEIPFAKTWGPRYGKGQGPKLSSINPYQLLSAEDRIDDAAHFDNPPIRELARVTVAAALAPGDPRMPEWVKLDAGVDRVLSIKEWMKDDDFHQLRDFLRAASRKFILRAPGHPDVGIELTGLNVSDGTGGFQGYGVKLDGKTDPGVEYLLLPLNQGHDHQWIVPKGVVWKS